jgi:tRNA pseudouridine38-40 synthase
MHYFLKIAYRGTAYHGWQMQENAHSVQAEMNEKISTLCGESVNVVGCGRTDAGVHAREFYLHFDLGKPMAFQPNDFVFKLNRFLPEDIVVYGAWEVPSEAHARFDAISRTYRYYISLQKDPFARELTLSYTGSLDVKAMRQAAGYLMDYEDFTSFSKLHTQTTTNLCRISEAGWKQTESQLVFTITADRFLRNMVRAIVGTLLEIGKGKLKPEEMKTIIEAKDRGRAGYSVPAQGLFLEEVRYPAELEKIFEDKTPIL